MYSPWNPRALGAVVVILLLTLGKARADEKYYLIMFGQDNGKAQLTHTFATFVKATGQGKDWSKHQLEVCTISWMPRALNVKFLKRPEEGVNLNLADSLRNAKAVNAEVSMWGPFEIKKELYDRAVKQRERLQSGDIDYKALDARFRPNVATNCIHAVSDVDMDGGLLMTGTATGGEASLLVLRHLSRWIVDPTQTHDWIATRLELGPEVGRRQVQLRVVEGSPK